MSDLGITPRRVPVRQQQNAGTLHLRIRRSVAQAQMGQVRHLRLRQLNRILGLRSRHDSIPPYGRRELLEWSISARLGRFRAEPSAALVVTHAGIRTSATWSQE